jgi:MinD-like ATPase involved in chromosome partitioning or flagellar assembly
MAKIISVHSYRGGTGKSNLTANLAFTLVSKGYRVAVVDTDIQSPGIHVLFKLKQKELSHSLNEFLWGKCEISDVAVEVPCQSNEGKLFVVPSSTNTGDIARIINDGYDVEVLSEGFNQLCTNLNLDFLLIDTHPGLNEETLLSIAVSDQLLIIMRPDQQDLEGSSITLKVASKLKVESIDVILNKVPSIFNPDELKREVETEFCYPVMAVIPHFDELMVLGSRSLFCQEYPDHPLSEIFREIGKKIG